MRRRWTSLVLVVLGALLAVGIMASSAFAGTVPIDTPDPDVPGGGTAVSDPGSLAKTGSDSTPSLVLAGLAAVAVGGVIVVAARRRREVLQRT
jgi:LPXTG-motif cell wall-anchored protein